MFQELVDPEILKQFITFDNDFIDQKKKAKNLLPSTSKQELADRSERYTS
jgi:hypothetical protein